jgi:hypothetical protein
MTVTFADAADVVSVVAFAWAAVVFLAAFYWLRRR